jgi:hypothetical protein
LDTARTPLLENLFCEHNRLTTLDLSQNAMLDTLYCRDNQLTLIALSPLAPLTDLFCARNRLPSWAAISGVERARLWRYSFWPQDAVVSLPPLSDAVKAAAAAAPAVMRDEYWYSFANLDPRLGPGPFSVNELIETFGSPVSIVGRMIDLENVDDTGYGTPRCGIVVFFADIGFSLVDVELDRLSFTKEVNFRKNLPLTEADKELKLYTYQTFIYGGEHVLPGGLRIGSAKEEIMDAYEQTPRVIVEQTLAYFYLPYYAGSEESSEQGGGAIRYYLDSEDKLVEVFISWNGRYNIDWD